MKARLLFVIAALALLAAAPGGIAKPKGGLRPVPKGIKIGALGKDYVALTQPYSWAEPGAAGLTIVTAIPRGVYRVKFEDDDGYYLPAPAQIGEKVEKVENATWLYEGGLYVRKKHPNEFLVYVREENGEFSEPRKMPWEFPKRLRQ